MEAIKLSMVALLFKWATFCVDWFMDFFAEPEYYWVEETYPSDVAAVRVARAFKDKVKNLSKLPTWIKKRKDKPVFIAPIHLNQILLSFCEVWRARVFNRFGPVPIRWA